MAAPQAVRLAFEACRPSRVASSLRLRPLPQARSFTSSQHNAYPKTITFGNPSAGATEPQPIDNDTATEQQIVESMPKAPPKRAPPSIARPPASPDQAATEHAHTIDSRADSGVPATADTTDNSKRKPYPPNVLAAYRLPMKHPAPYGLPVASLQLRSFSVRNLEFFADFCLRAAFYLSLPASGPVPLPKRIQRWTVIRSNFIFKKSQENFERITYKRLITIMDGEKSAVETWLAFIRKWQFYGVGMKANVWEFEGVDVAGKMDAQAKDLEADLAEKMGLFGFTKQVGQRATLAKLLERQERGKKVVGSPTTEVGLKYLTPEGWAERFGVDPTIEQEHRQAGGSKTKTLLCFNCQQYGHRAVDCPNFAIAAKHVQCYNCEEVGHKASECPKPKKHAAE